MKKITFITLLLLSSFIATGASLDQTGVRVITESPVGLVGRSTYPDTGGAAARTVDINDFHTFAPAGVAGPWCWNFSDAAAAGSITEQCQGGGTYDLTVAGTGGLDAAIDAEGVSNGILFSDADNDKATNTSTDFDMTSHFSLALWVNPTTWAPGTFKIFLQNYISGQGWNLQIDSGNLLEFNGFSGSATHTHEVDTSNLSGWHHIAVAFEDNVGSAIYIDGQLISFLADSSTTITYTTGDFRAGGELFDGSIDEVVVQRDIVWDIHQVREFYFASDKSSLHGGVGFAPLTTTEPGTTAAETLALYNFANGALEIDTKGSFNLTPFGTPTNCAGITGSDYCAEYNGTNSYHTQATLLDVTPAAIAIDFWFKPDDGVPASFEALFEKNNDGSNTMSSQIHTDGHIFFTTVAGGISKQVDSSTFLSNGPEKWHYLALNWDAVNGLRLWLDGVLESVDASATTLLTSGITTNFAIGRRHSSSDRHFDGKIALFRVRDKILTQQDVEIGHSFQAAHGSTTFDIVDLKGKSTLDSVLNRFSVEPYINGYNSTNVYMDFSGDFEPGELIQLKY